MLPPRAERSSSLDDARVVRSRSSSSSSFERSFASRVNPFASRRVVVSRSSERTIEYIIPAHHQTVRERVVAADRWCGRARAIAIAVACLLLATTVATSREPTVMKNRPST